MNIKNMAQLSNFYIISKVTPYGILFPSGMLLEQYMVSEDFFYPLTDSESALDYSSPFITDTSPCNRQTADKNSYTTDELRNRDYPIESLCSCVQNLEFVKFMNKIKVKIDATLFSMVMIELKRSKAFRKNMLLNFFKLYVHKKKFGVSNRPCATCNRRSVKIHAVVFMTAPKINVLDYKWSRKIQILVNEKCELENAMAWLSTLGGAFSALGDYYIECAEKAGAISIQQFHIALRLGDPLTICRCKIYLAMSLLQRGYYKKTKHIIRELYKFSTEGEGSKDFRLKNMCLAVWNRLRYMLSKKIKLQ